MLSIIIIHWNTPENLESLLKGLRDFKGEVIVVDNGSASSIRELKVPQAPESEIKLLYNTYNQGYAFAANQGAVASSGDYLLFANPDVKLTPSIIKQMLEEAEENKYDACSPISSSSGYRLPLPTPSDILKRYTPLGKLFKQVGGASSSIRELKAPQAPGSDKNANSTKTLKHYTLFGGCLLIRRSVFEAIGGWDEQFFVWYEDADLTKRLIDGGYRTGWLSTEVKHQGGASFSLMEDSTKKQIFFHSLIQYARKHWSRSSWWIAYLVAKKYGASDVLPHLTNSIDITVPNMKRPLVDIFLDANRDALQRKKVTYTIVSSDIKKDHILEYKEEFPGIRWIMISNNKGFAATVNIGLRSSAGEWMGTVNDDVVLPPIRERKNSHAPGSKHLGYLTTDLPADTGSVNPIIAKEDGSIESAGIKILKKGKATPVSDIPEQLLTTTDATNAAAVLYSKSALKKTGLFDERFGSYLEDIDLSLRLSKKGYRNYVRNDISVIHKGQSTSISLGRKKRWLDFKNWNLVILKNWSLLDMTTHIPQIILERLRNISGILKAT